MGAGIQKEEKIMTCSRCGGSQIEDQITDLPFKLDAQKILVVKQTPAMVCNSCGETMLSDSVMEHIDSIIEKLQGLDSELEVVKFAA
ncbi:MAG: YgiT-type zinc finger domain-containing protein [Candidatus Promineifilaceae bacterium]|jgi:YgiT-type zinc finger domain-containing protein